MHKNNVLIFIPTYNEADNVETIFQQLRQQNLPADFLFLDDNSPDGTGKIIDKMVAANTNTFVIHRPCKSGIGSAHQEGIRWAYANTYDVLITMDCDFTHSPDYISEFIKHSANADIVIGSRYMQPDSLKEWNLFRKSLTHFGHFMTKYLLGMPYDASGAFRLYQLKHINKNIFDLVLSERYAFFFESLFILHLNKISIHEIPIYLPARTYGTSKMSWGDTFNSLRQLIGLYQRKLLHKNSMLLK